MLKKTIKKVMALSAGASMVGATLLGASAAADLSEYPAPFIQDGQFNAILVVGDNAASSDVIGSVDIATSLQFASRTAKSVSSDGGTTVTVDGDAWKVGTSSKEFELSENLDSGTNRELINGIKTFITDSELGALADGSFRTNKGEFDYEQYLRFENTATGYVYYDKDTESEGDDADRIGTFLYFGNDDQIGRYSLEFTEPAESDITDSSGSDDTTGTYLWSYEGQNINLLGTVYSVVQARRDDSSGASAKLTLMGGAARDVLDEGEETTYSVKGKDYKVKVTFIGSNTAKFQVDGEVTDSLQEGQTYKLNDGTEIGVRDILAQQFAGGKRAVEFYVGAQKIVLWDTDVTDTVSSKDLEFGGEDVDNAQVIIEGTDDNSTFKITKIGINVTASDNFFVAPGEKVSEKMDDPNALLGRWDIIYEGLTEQPMDTIKIAPSGDDTYKLSFTDGNGNLASVPIGYTSGTNLDVFGDDSDVLVLLENMAISEDSYFILSDGSQTDGERQTFVMQYRGADDSSKSSPQMKFKDIGSGETINRAYSLDSATNSYKVTLTRGGADFDVYNNSVVSTSDFTVNVDLDGDGSAPGSFESTPIAINTQYGAKIEVLNVTNDPAGGAILNYTTGVKITTVNSDDYETLTPTAIVYNITAASGEVALSENGNLKFVSPEDDNNKKFSYTAMGAMIEWDDPTSDPDDVTITYPKTQVLPLVYVTSGAISTSSTEVTEGQVVYYETTPIEVGSAKLAGEVSNIMAQNAIVIGGPCANPAAATLMGNPADCTAGFIEGVAFLRLLEHDNGNVALLVAGASAMDTRRAARVLANYDAYTDQMEGVEVVVTGTSFTDITVSAPTPEVEDSEDDDSMEGEDGEEETTTGTEE